MLYYLSMLSLYNHEINEYEINEDEINDRNLEILPIYLSMHYSTRLLKKGFHAKNIGENKSSM